MNSNLLNNKIDLDIEQAQDFNELVEEFLPEQG
jgi:hypothetical protein